MVPELRTKAFIAQCLSSEMSSMEAAEQYKNRVTEGQLYNSDSSLYP